MTGRSASQSGRERQNRSSRADVRSHQALSQHPSEGLKPLKNPANQLNPAYIELFRGSLGNWCGYVGVAEGHPWFERDYDELAVDVHYGLTFAAFCHEDGDEATDICHVPGPGEVARIWWLGFDTSHGGDYPPSYGEKLDAYRSSYGGVDDESKWPACTYKTEAYVRREVATVAAQAVQAAARMPDDA